MILTKNRPFDISATQVVKGVAICLLLFYHLFSQEQVNRVNLVPMWTYGGFNLTLIFAHFSNVCIYIFAMLTGYGIAATYKGEYAPFVFKRLVKLYSLFFAIFVLAQMIGPIFGKNLTLYGSPYVFIIDAFGLADLFQSDTFNSTWWYMSFAIVIVFIAPLFIELCQFCKNGFVALLLALALVLTFHIQYEALIFSTLFGIIINRQQWLKKIQEISFSLIPWRNFLLKFLLLLVILMASADCLLRYNRETFSVVASAILSFTLITFIFLYISPIPGIQKLLFVLGKHSGNIFLLHTFIHVSFFNNFIYSFHYPLLIFFILLLLSLLSSVVIEFIKAKTRYNKLTQYIYQKI